MTVMAQAVETKTAVYKRPRPKWRKWAKAVLAVALCAALFYLPAERHEPGDDFDHETASGGGI